MTYYYFEMYQKYIELYTNTILDYNTWKNIKQVNITSVIVLILLTPLLMLLAYDCINKCDLIFSIIFLILIYFNSFYIFDLCNDIKDIKVHIKENIESQKKIKVEMDRIGDIIKCQLKEE